MPNGGNPLADFIKSVGTTAAALTMPGFAEGFAGASAQKAQAEQQNQLRLLDIVAENPDMAATPAFSQQLKKMGFGDEAIAGFANAAAEQQRRQREAVAATLQQIQEFRQRQQEAGAAPSEFEFTIGPRGGLTTRDIPVTEAKTRGRAERKFRTKVNQLRRKGRSLPDAVAETFNTPGFEAVPEEFQQFIPAGPIGQAAAATQPPTPAAPTTVAPSPPVPPAEPPPPITSPTQPLGEPSQLVEQPEVGTTRIAPTGQASRAVEEGLQVTPKPGETAAAFTRRQKTAQDALVALDIPITDSKVLLGWMDEQGQPPPPGTTERQLIDKGYKPAGGIAKKLKGGSLSVLAKMASVWEKEFRGSSRLNIFDRTKRRFKGDKVIQDIANFEATLGNLIQDIADEGRRVSDADAKRFANLRYSLWDNDETSFSKMVFVAQMLERSYLGVGKPVPPELMNLKKRYNIPTIEVSPDPSIPLVDAITPGRAIPAEAGTIELGGGFRFVPKQQ